MAESMNMLELSVVVPTRNRKTQCQATVQSVLVYRGDFEVVVFDTGDDDELDATLSSLADPRVRYIRGPRGGLNMTQCFELAVSLAQGRYICMIGDDDGVAPALFDWAKRCDALGLTSVTTRPESYAAYNWPDVTSKYFGNAASGRLWVRIPSTTGCSVVDLHHELRAFLARAGQGCGSLPRVYHGLIRRDVLQAMRARFGRCFDGVSPDVSFSYLAAKCAVRHALVDEVLTISGACAASNAGRSAMRRHKGDLWSDPHMVHYAGERWPAEVPEFFSVETVWAQATLKAIEAAADGDWVNFDYARLYALCLLRHPDRAGETLRAMRCCLLRLGAARAPMALISLFAQTILVAGQSAASVCTKLYRKVRHDPRVREFRALSILEASGIVRTVSGGGNS